jgi:RNA polymerase sigma-70 factor (ECF subfamily)
MARINLRDYYPWYTKDTFVNVPDNTADVFMETRRAERAYMRRLYRNKAQYSLDRGDGIEGSLLNKTADPMDDYETKAEMRELYAAISKLPLKQAKRIYGFYILGLSKADIANIEGIGERAVQKSIADALEALKKFL